MNRRFLAQVSPRLDFRRFTNLVDTCISPASAPSYFNMQAVVLETSSSNALLRGNMQGEYR